MMGGGASSDFFNDDGGRPGLAWVLFPSRVQFLRPSLVACVSGVVREVLPLPRKAIPPTFFFGLPNSFCSGMFDLWEMVWLLSRGVRDSELGGLGFVSVRFRYQFFIQVLSERLHLLMV